MVSWAAAFQRLKKLRAFANLQETDFTPATYAQIHASLSSGSTGVSAPQSFPGGAIILGITAAAYITSTAAASQPAMPRQFFGLSFAYTNNQSLTPGGPVNADALLGAGDDTIFPLRELVIAPNQSMTCQPANYSTSTIIIHVCYHTMVYRLAGG